MKKVSVVIPTYYEIDNIKKLCEKFNDFHDALYDVERKNVKLVIVDDTPNDNIYSYVTNINVSWAKVIQNWDRKGYGESIKMGFSLSEPSDIYIMMDVDHPIRYIFDILNGLDKFDVMVGYEIDVKSKEREVTKLLCKDLLGLNLNQPTCGFIGMNKNVFKDERVNWMSIRSNYDVFHVELLKMCLDAGYNIGEFGFQPYEVKHRYGLMRDFRWLVDFARLLLKS